MRLNDVPHNALVECEKNRISISRKILRVELDSQEMKKLLAEKIGWEKEISRLGGCHRMGSRYLLLRYSEPSIVSDDYYNDEMLMNRIHRVGRTCRPILGASKSFELDSFLPDCKKAKLFK